MSQTAIIIHEILDVPKNWKMVDDEYCITNGYYRVACDGAFYSMGTGKYNTSQVERDSLSKAVSVWKDETGWRPPTKAESKKTKEKSIQPITSTEFKKQVHDEYVRSTRSALKSFSIHKNAGILSGSIQRALDVLDGALKPMEKIEGKASNAKGDGVSGA